MLINVWRLFVIHLWLMFVYRIIIYSESSFFHVLLEQMLGGTHLVHWCVTLLEYFMAQLCSLVPVLRQTRTKFYSRSTMWKNVIVSQMGLKGDKCLGEHRRLSVFLTGISFSMVENGVILFEWIFTHLRVLHFHNVSIFQALRKIRQFIYFEFNWSLLSNVKYIFNLYHNFLVWS